MVQTAQNATHARKPKILSTPNVPHSAPEKGVRSCGRSMDFHAWSKQLKMPRMRGSRKCSVLQMCPTALLRGVSVRASVRWISMRGPNGSKCHACAIDFICNAISFDTIIYRKNHCPQQDNAPTENLNKSILTSDILQHPPFVEETADILNHNHTCQ